MPDFEIEQYLQEVTRTRGNRIRRVFHPEEGSDCTVVFISHTNGGPILQKLNQIENLADSFQKVVWVADAQEGYRPSVDVRVTVNDRDSVPTEEL